MCSSHNSLMDRSHIRRPTVDVYDHADQSVQLTQRWRVLHTDTLALRSRSDSLYSAGAYRTGETQQTPSSSAAPTVVNRFGSMTLRASAPSPSPSAVTSPKGRPAP